MLTSAKRYAPLGIFAAVAALSASLIPPTLSQEAPTIRIDGPSTVYPVTEAAAEAGIGIKHGHFYAYRLMEALGIEPQRGVVRVSFSHYNTLEEASRLRQVLEPLLG
jgi:selenocysteine lyase/cysteine desulfurase